MKKNAIIRIFGSLNHKICFHSLLLGPCYKGQSFNDEKPMIFIFCIIIPYLIK
jgi:hypothetical protein